MYIRRIAVVFREDSGSVVGVAFKVWKGRGKGRVGRVGRVRMVKGAGAVGKDFIHLHTGAHLNIRQSAPKAFQI